MTDGEPIDRGAGVPEVLDRSAYVLDVDDDFDGPDIDDRLWFPHYLPHWSSRAASVARYRIADGCLHLAIEVDQPPWCPEFDGWLRVSAFQTGALGGPLGSGLGQHRFPRGLVVREEQPPLALLVPRYGLVEARVAAPDDPRTMVAMWMIGYEDEPAHSAEICLFEIFGRDVGPRRSTVGIGLHPFGDSSIADDFLREEVAIDARGFHTYAATWMPDRVAFYVDDRLVKVAGQSPGYPMQVMLTLYEFAEGPQLGPPADYPKEFVVDWFRYHRPA